jgi:hypothetical protein
MNAGDIYSKSARGIEEVSNRMMNLSSEARTMLILVDGHVPIFALREAARKVGAAPDFLEQLQTMGLVVKSGSVASQNVVSAQRTDEFTRFRLAQDFMNKTVVNALGIKAFFFTLRLERASNLKELRELIASYKEAIAKGSGEAEADVLASRLQAMMD